MRLMAGNESYFVLNVQRNIVKSKAKWAPLLLGKFNNSGRLSILRGTLQ